LQQGEALMVDNLQNLPEGIFLSRQDEYKTRSFISMPMICSPLQVGKKKIGVLNVTEKRQHKSFTSGDFKLLNSIAAIAAIAIYNHRLIEKVLESERLKRDLEIAESIQLSLLPTQFPTKDDFQIYGRCRSAKNVGGDYFDFSLSQSQHLDMVVADVSGHSIGAALMMTNTRNVLRSLMQENLSVGEILQKANQLLFEDMNRAGLFISIFFLRYNRRTHQLVYANGGHHPVLWYQAKSKTIFSLDADGLLLGVMPQVDFAERTVQLEPGDLLVMYTDGLVETANLRGELYGLKNLKETILALSQFDASTIVEKIFGAVDDFAESLVQTDDITLQVMKVTAKDKLDNCR